MATTQPEGEVLVQAIRGIFKDRLGLTNAQIILAEVTAYRPPMPYLTIKALAPGQNTEGIDWVSHRQIAGNQQQNARGYREASISINSYGTLAATWLEDFLDFIQHEPETRELMKTYGISVLYPLPAPTDITELVDSAFEKRTAITLGVAYERENVQIVEDVELEVVELTTEFDSHSGPTAITITETIDPENPPC